MLLSNGSNSSPAISKCNPASDGISKHNCKMCQAVWWARFGWLMTCNTAEWQPKQNHLTREWLTSQHMQNGLQAHQRLASTAVIAWRNTQLRTTPSLLPLFYTSWCNNRNGKITLLIARVRRCHKVLRKGRSTPCSRVRKPRYVGCLIHASAIAVH